MLLAAFWYDGRHGPVSVCLLGAVVLALGVAPVGRSFITRRPVLALRTLEAYSWINGLLTAVVGCATVVITVELAGIAGKEDPVKEVVTQVGGALTALVGGFLVATKDVDETLGKRIAKEFLSKFSEAGRPKPGTVELKADSPSLLAVFTKYENGWTDWSVDNREARVASLAANLATDRA